LQCTTSVVAIVCVDVAMVVVAETVLVVHDVKAATRVTPVKNMLGMLVCLFKSIGLCKHERGIGG
jgi:MinD superfamily P-loop ATPase